jgi:uncharacterized protein YkwD
MAGSIIAALRLSAAGHLVDGSPSPMPLLTIGESSETGMPVSTAITSRPATSSTAPTSVTTTTGTPTSGGPEVPGSPSVAGGPSGPVRTVALPGPVPSSPPRFGVNQPPLNNDSAAAGQLMSYLNEVRARARCGPLVESPSLDAAAVRHANDMADNHFFGQQGSDGSTPQQRDQLAGYPSPYGEDNDRGGDARQVIYQWLNNDSTRQNLLNCGLRAFGVGVDTQGWYWTADFGQ